MMKNRAEARAAKTDRKLQQKQRTVLEWLEKHNVFMNASDGHECIILSAYSILGVEPKRMRKTSAVGLHSKYSYIMSRAGIVQKKARAPKIAKVSTIKEAEKFYESYEWRQLRYRVLKRDGAKCALCGATRSDGVKLHVDHIKPLRKNPDLALDINNLQVLCEVCNHGKGNWDETDWRLSS